MIYLIITPPLFQYLIPRSLQTIHFHWETMQAPLKLPSLHKNNPTRVGAMT